MYEWRNIETRSSNNCRRGKTVSVTYYERVPLFVSQLYGTEFTYFLRRIVLPGSTTFFHIIS